MSDVDLSAELTLKNIQFPLAVLDRCLASARHLGGAKRGLAVGKWYFLARLFNVEMWCISMRGDHYRGQVTNRPSLLRTTTPSVGLVRRSL